jgi:hypothetical protein
MEFYLAPLGGWVTIIEGMIFVICVMSFREGIIGIIGSSKAAIRRWRAPSAEPEAGHDGRLAGEASRLQATARDA